MNKYVQQHSELRITEVPNDFNRMERELAAGYLEVPSGGLSAEQVVSVYTIVLRTAMSRTFAVVRSLLGADTAAQS